jgi:acetylornithine deacetylase/succinyl-diaminopimelate desuccinylase-like protein
MNAGTLGWEAYLTEHRQRSLGEFLEFLRIPSISTLPEHAGDVQRAAEWLAARMARAGLERVEILPTERHPVVYGEWGHAEGKPTVLLYGHYDVQPVDPLELWTTRPFEPEMRDGRVYARGASDMKGNALMLLLAIEALLTTEGALPVNVKCFFEGEEEIGSPSLASFIESNRDRLASDLIVNADGLQLGEDEPALLIATKGLCGLEIQVRGPETDLHSGIHGGPVANPIRALARIIGSMHDADNRILVDGFYDDVVPLTDEERAQIKAVPFDEAAYRQEVGVADLVPEPGFSTLEHRWARPTLEFNGIWGGFQGEGNKTVLPAEANVKITCRLVPNQDPEKIKQLVIQHVEKHAPPGARVTIKPRAIGAHPYYVSANHWANRAAAAALAATYQKEPHHTRMGGTVPVLGLFERLLRVPIINLGFTLADENLHAPNEYFRLRSFERGQEVYARLLHNLGHAPGEARGG